MIRFLLVPFSCATLVAQSAVLTVSNNPAVPGQYGDIDSAIAAAQAGDTLYLQPSPNVYSSSPNIYFTIPLTFIGAGYNSPSVTGLRSWAGSFSPQPGASNSSYIGLSFTSPWAGIVNQSNGDLGRIDYCTFENGASLVCGDGALIARSIFDTDYAMNIGAFCIFNNNVVVARASNPSWSGMTCYGGGTTVIKNNLFVSPDDEFAIGLCTDATIADNIFYGARAIDATQTVNCTINNNITFGSTQDALPLGSNTGVNNLVGQDPMFAQASSFDFSFADDYSLQVGSPAIGNGSDGLDIGIFGGPYPMKAGLIGQALPYVTEFIVVNSVVQVGTDVNIVLKAKKRP